MKTTTAESALNALVYTIADMCKLAHEFSISRHANPNTAERANLLAKGEGLREGFLILCQHIKKYGLEELVEITAKDINKKLSK